MSTSPKAARPRLGMVGARVVRRWAGQILVVGVVSTLVLMVHLTRTHSQETARESLEQRKAEIREQLRHERLHELQGKIFVNARRPPDAKYNINVTRSEEISLEREITDTRPPGCRDIRYDVTSLPSVSVIIPFYNEALSMLLRTVHSIIKRTPPELLEEIILVKDFATNEDLGEKLEKYIKLLPKVHLVKTTKREGLIRARMIGAGLAKGEVLMFQDAHTENNVQWAEPLLAEIKKDPTTIMQPQVDTIEQWTIEYAGSTMGVPRGGFTWDLRFLVSWYVWMRMPDHESQRLKGSATAPHRIATLVGCALAVQKKHFLAIGGFDDGMNVWGGENLELAMRNWLCAGPVLNHPCSRVGHVFKPFTYQFDGDREKIVQKNCMRLAELWMDDWKKFFLGATYSWVFKRTHLNREERATLQQRKVLRDKLQCKPFKWYMDNIVPEIPTPPMEATYYGEVANLKSEACLYVSEDKYIGMTYECFFHRLLPENIFYIDTDGRLVHQQENRCVRVDYTTWLLHMDHCLGETSDEYWHVVPTSFYEGSIRVNLRDKNTGERREMCVIQVTNVNQVHYRDQMPQLMACDDTGHIEFQGWRWQYKFDFNYNFDPPS